MQLRTDFDLNPAQLQAVEYLNGPLLIVAGAGSGKTRVLTYRIANLISSGGIEPWQILAITFTNKAADEMRNRIISQVGELAKQMWVSTFHSTCVRILRVHADKLGFTRSFSIYDDLDSRRLMGQVLEELKVDTKRITPKSVLELIGKAKCELIDERDYADIHGGDGSGMLEDAYRLYSNRLQQLNAMDFDDLLTMVVRLFRRFPDVSEQYSNRFVHVLVDEYQDTNHVQGELVKLFGQKHKNVCVVGDTDQSIYGFRGADISNIIQFEKAFGNAKIVLLEQNYRSTQNILDSANAVIANNSTRIAKRLWTENATGEPVYLKECCDEREESEWVGVKIEELYANSSLRWDDMAVMYRTQAQSRSIEDEFLRRAIPYQVVGGTRFYDRKEIKDILAYLRVVYNPKDEISLRRIINEPKRGIGLSSIAKLADMAENRGVGLYEMVMSAGGSLPAKAAKGIREFALILKDIKNTVDTAAVVSEVISYVVERSGYADYLMAEATAESQARYENLAELVSVAADFDTLEDFLQASALQSMVDEMVSDKGLVSLMTLHVAKGLEFDTVFMVGMEEGLFPHSRSLEDPKELEEERRLCYVGMTRAKQRLYLSHAWERRMWGSIVASPRSRFLDEIPEDLVSYEAAYEESYEDI
ncbi:MAG: UvrD-helicase domain-containing protein [Actinobacteria bacterium]|nr:UvrD-helicase domain-containing protein [Actinomycetota bacterium]MCL6104967.1 UvrD-helicase domain-containing protein [Actinomycetota bacterium]